MSAKNRSNNTVAPAALSRYQRTPHWLHLYCDYVSALDKTVTVLATV